MTTHTDWDGVSHQGHRLSGHRLSFPEALLLFRAMGGDEGAARMAERAESAEAALKNAERQADSFCEGLRTRDVKLATAEAALSEARKTVEQLQARIGVLLAFARPEDLQAAEIHIATHGLVNANGEPLASSAVQEVTP